MIWSIQFGDCRSGKKWFQTGEWHGNDFWALQQETCIHWQVRGVCVGGWEGFEIIAAVVLIDRDVKLALFYFYFFVAAMEGWFLQWLLIKSQASAVYLCPTFLLWQVAVPINKCMYSVLYDGAEISWCIQPLFLVKAEMWKWILLRNRQRYETL